MLEKQLQWLLLKIWLIVVLINYPIALLGVFSEFLKDNTNYQRIAMAVSLADAPKAIRFLNNVDWLNVSVVFLRL